MQADLPHTLYFKERKDPDGKPIGNTKASDSVVRLQEEATRRMLEARKRKL